MSVQLDFLLDHLSEEKCEEFLVVGRLVYVLAEALRRISTSPSVDYQTESPMPTAN